MDMVSNMYPMTTATTNVDASRVIIVKDIYATLLQCSASMYRRSATDMIIIATSTSSDMSICARFMMPRKRTLTFTDIIKLEERIASVNKNLEKVAVRVSGECEKEEKEEKRLLRLWGERKKREESKKRAGQHEGDRKDRKKMMGHRERKKREKRKNTKNTINLTKKERKSGKKGEPEKEEKGSVEKKKLERKKDRKSGVRGKKTEKKVGGTFWVILGVKRGFWGFGGVLGCF